MTQTRVRAHTNRQRTVHVEHCMGTTFTIDIRDPGNWSDAIRDVVSWLHEVDHVFSTYRHESDISRLRRGELTLEAANPEIADVLGLCADAQLTTAGYFTAMPNGQLDPTGLVKGWAIEHASRRLTAHAPPITQLTAGATCNSSARPLPGGPGRSASATRVTPAEFSRSCPGEISPLPLRGL
jgi:thiamine biosynthesis lipoprotein